MTAEGKDRPITGLESFLSGLSPAEPGSLMAEWSSAVQTTAREISIEMLQEMYEKAVNPPPPPKPRVLVHGQEVSPTVTNLAEQLGFEVVASAHVPERTVYVIDPTLVEEILQESIPFLRPREHRTVVKIIDC